MGLLTGSCDFCNRWLSPQASISHVRLNLSTTLSNSCIGMATILQSGSSEKVHGAESGTAFWKFPHLGVVGPRWGARSLHHALRDLVASNMLHSKSYLAATVHHGPPLGARGRQQRLSARNTSRDEHTEISRNHCSHLGANPWNQNIGTRIMMDTNKKART